MRLSSLALLAWIILGQVGVADDAAPADANSTPLNLPPPPSAQNADEAPRWDGSAVSNATTGASPNAADVPAPDDPPPPTAAKPLQSVMKNAPKAAPQRGVSGGVAPAQFQAPATGATSPAQRTNPIRSTPPAAQPAAAPAVGSTRTENQPAAVVRAGPAASGDPTIGKGFSISPTDLNPPSSAASRQNAAGVARTIGSGPSSAAPPAASWGSDGAVDAEKMAAARAAGDLLATSMSTSARSSDETSTLTISLSTAISSFAEQNRLGGVHNYWRLSRAIGDYNWALDELQRLERIVPTRTSFEGPMLSTARAAAAARVQEAKIAVVHAHEVLELGMGQTRPSPLAYDAVNKDRSQTPPAPHYYPSDVPLVGPYRTYYDVLFASRAPAGRTREIHRALPIWLLTINDRTAAVQSATSAVHFAEEAHAKGEADMRTVLACHEELHKQRRSFLDAVRDYNLQIAEYALTIAPPGTSNEKLAGMLITSKAPQRVSAAPGRAPATSSGDSNPRGSSGATLPGTSAGPSNNAATGAPTSNPRSLSSDGWVPSSSRSAETPATQLPPADPFAAPNVGSRYAQ